MRRTVHTKIIMIYTLFSWENTLFPRNGDPEARSLKLVAWDLRPASPGACRCRPSRVRRYGQQLHAPRSLSLHVSDIVDQRHINVHSPVSNLMPLYSMPCWFYAGRVVFWILPTFSKLGLERERVWLVMWHCIDRKSQKLSTHIIDSRCVCRHSWACWQMHVLSMNIWEARISAWEREEGYIYPDAMMNTTESRRIFTQLSVTSLTRFVTNAHRVCHRLWCSQWGCSFMVEHQTQWETRLLGAIRIYPHVLTMVGIQLSTVK